MKLGIFKETNNQTLELEKVIEGTWADIRCWEEDNTVYHLLPFEDIGEGEAYVWDDIEYRAGYVKDGKVIKWLDRHFADLVYQAFWWTGREIYE